MKALQSSYNFSGQPPNLQTSLAQVHHFEDWSAALQYQGGASVRHPHRLSRAQMPQVDTDREDTAIHFLDTRHFADSRHKSLHRLAVPERSQLPQAMWSLVLR